MVIEYIKNLSKLNENAELKEK